MVIQQDLEAVSKNATFENIRNAFFALDLTNGDIWSLPRRNPKEYAHSLFQYPAMMVPEVQKQIIQTIISADPNVKSLLDPYVGAGTTITAAMRCGLNATGQDINPLAVLVAKAKTDFGWSDEGLLQAFDMVVDFAKNDPDSSFNVHFPNQSKWFQPNVSIELSKLRRAIIQQTQKTARRVLWVALAETIRLTSNDRTTTYKLHARPADEIGARQVSPISVFETIARSYVLDLIEFKHVLEINGLIFDEQYSGQINIMLSDTAQRINSSNDKFDLVITSPPYGDNLTTITYGQHALYLSPKTGPRAKVIKG